MVRRNLYRCFLPVVVFFVLLGGVAGADSLLVSADFVRELYEYKYPWLGTGALEDHLLADIECEEFKLVGFSEKAIEDMMLLDETAFFLVTVEDGVNRVNDVSASFRHRYQYHYPHVLNLPELGEVIRLTVSHFTHHGLAITYIVSSKGVLLELAYDDIAIQNDDSFVITSVGYSDIDYVLWDFSTGFTAHPSGGAFWSSVDVFQIQPYNRYVYEWDQSKLAFELIESVPLNHAAVLDAFLESARRQDWERASVFIDDIDSAFDNHQIVSALSKGITGFVGVPNENVLRMQTESGEQFDFVFDIGWEDTYQTRRRRFSNPHEMGPWAPQPKIVSIKLVVDVTALFNAIDSLDFNAEVIQTLVEAGADVNARDDNGITALMYAVDRDNANAEVIRTLVNAGANVNAQNEGGITALMLAAYNENSNVEVIRALVNADANVNARSAGGTTALMFAVYNENSNVEVIGTLVKAGANVNARTEEGITALMLAGNHDQEALKSLIEAGADLNTNDHDGWTPLFYAVHYQNIEAIRLLVEAGADVNAAESFDELTALMVAVLYGSNPEIIQTLLDAGADGKLKSKEDKTAFDYAKENPNIFGTDVYWLLNDARF